VHVHNTFMMISPSIYSACCEAEVPVVQTLHNIPVCFVPLPPFFATARFTKNALAAPSGPA
jgi:hypothetical protein